MARLNIDVGDYPNDESADSIQEGFTKTNSNFEKIWSAGPVDTDIRIVGDTIAATSDSETGDINLVPGPSGRVFMEKLDVDILNVHDDLDVDNITVNTIIGGTSITAPNINATIKLTADTIEANTLDITNPISSLSINNMTIFTLTVDDNTTLNRNLIVTDGNGVSPENYFSVDGVTGRTTINKVLNLPIEESTVDKQGQYGDKKGDVRIDEDYIYVCFDDWVDKSPLAQPDIWGRSSLTWNPVP